MDEAKLISRQIAETRVEIAVCTRLKANGVMMRLGKPVGDLLVAYEMKLVDLENQLQALGRKPAPKVAAAAVPAKPAAPAAKPSAPTAIKAPTPVATKPAVAPDAAKPAAPIAAKPAAPVKPAALVAKSASKTAALEPKAAPARKTAPAKPRK